MKVLCIPEDQELDRYIIKPVVEALFEDLSRKARVEVLPEPRLRGSSQALDPAMVERIVAENRMVDLFLLIVDRDGNRQQAVEKAASRVAEQAGKLIACLAEQEVEVWLLALHKEQLPVGISWREVREHHDPKEAFAEPLLDKLGSLGPGKGRQQAMRALKGQWKTLLALCPELETLRQQIEGWVQRQSGGAAG